MTFAVFPEVAGSGSSVVGQSSLFIFRPLEPAPAGNVYASWAALVAAAAIVVGPKAVYFDDTLAPCVIPAGAWNFGSCTTFFGCDGRWTPTPVTIDDGATLVNVFAFVSLDITSNSTTFVIDAPVIAGTVLYRLYGTTIIRQLGIGGRFIRANNPGLVILALIERGELNTGAGPVVDVTNPAGSLTIAVLDLGVLGTDTIGAVVGAGTSVDVYSPGATVSTSQVGVLPGGLITVQLLDFAALVSYDDSLVPPLLGVSDVQAAIDALKGTIVTGTPYEYVFQPGGVASGNIYDIWANLVAAAAAFPGTKLVYFDNSIAPCTIPIGVWNFASATTFIGNFGLPSVAGPSLSPTPLTIDDGAVLQNVFEFKSLDITSNSKSPVNTAPFPGARYTFSGTTKITQVDPVGEFIRSATGFVFSPVEIVLLESAKLLTGGGPAINVTNPGANASIYAFDNSIVQPSTIAAAALTVAGFTVDSASIAIAQPGVFGGILPVTLLSAAARVSYDDTLALPPLGVTEVQAAIDALKGGAIAGNPNSLGYFNPAGNALTSSVDLTAFPLDPFGRPQIWDKRVGGAGAVYRNGSWSQDGDPTNVTGDGFISYGANAIGLGPNATDGGYARIKPNRFGLAQVIGGGPLTYAWRVDYTQMIMRNDVGTETFSIDRATGNTFIVADGRLFMGNNGVLHGSSARIQLSTTIANAAQLRGYQYGANTASAGITTFKSRGAAIGALGSVLPGDLLGRWTSIGVAADGASIQLAATLSVQVPVGYVPVGTDSWVPTEFEVALVALAGPANSRRPVQLVTSEGVTQTLRGVRAGGPSTLSTALGTGTLWSSDSVNPNGTIFGSPGDIYSKNVGGVGSTFWIKESGVNTNTGWNPLTAVDSKSFSGALLGDQLALAVIGYFADVPNTSFLSTIGYPVNTNSRNVILTVNVTANSLITATTFEIFKNNVATGISITVAALATGVQPSTTQALVLVGGTDVTDLRATNTTGGNGNQISAAATITYQA